MICEYKAINGREELTDVEGSGRGLSRGRNSRAVERSGGRATGAGRGRDDQIGGSSIHDDLVVDWRSTDLNGAVVLLWVMLVSFRLEECISKLILATGEKSTGGTHDVSRDVGELDEASALGECVLRCAKSIERRRRHSIFPVDTSNSSLERFDVLGTVTLAQGHAGTLAYEWNRLHFADAKTRQ